MAEEVWIIADEERACPKLNERSEGCLEFALSAGLHDLELHAFRPRRLLYLSYRALAQRIVRVHKQADYTRLGNQFREQINSLGIELSGEDGNAREVAARPREARNQAACDRVDANLEDDWDR